MSVAEYLIVCGSAVSKAPQLHRLLLARGNGSTACDSILSPYMFASEAVAQLTALAYYGSQRAPLMSYAENLPLALQNTCIAVLLLLRRRRRRSSLPSAVPPNAGPSLSYKQLATAAMLLAVLAHTYGLLRVLNAVR